MSIRPQTGGSGPAYDPSRGGWYPAPASASATWQCNGPCGGTFPAPGPADQICTACRSLAY
ncbi:hypothetical protein [Streptomyces sp. NPDC049879]|uniref:hypothetical protein n=1 Tax=Streptomyces sp. NPDC049879 TaxID=3365598 RepID=UPI0037B44A23